MNSGMILQELDFSMAHLVCGYKEASWPYQAPLRRVAYTLQQSLREELEWLQKQQIMAPLGVFAMLEWCNSFVLVQNWKWYGVTMPGSSQSQ